MRDEFSPYEAGVCHLLEMLGDEHPAVETVLIYQQRLYETIAQARLYGDTNELQADRAQIIHELNRITADAFDTTFNELYGRTPQITTAPFQVPQRNLRFVGREQELRCLFTLLTDRKTSNICCITGMGGVGKTALAIQFAHQFRDYFADGILWANAATSDTLAIIDSWAHAYDSDFDNLSDVHSRAAALRDLLDHKQALAILDDVREASLVQPLLPGGSTCGVLVTTRNVEIAYELDSTVLPLSELSDSAGISLLTNILGRERVQSEVNVAREITGVLKNLPLAVEIAAERLASRPRWQLADLAKRLRDTKRRLQLLRIGDTEVRASFEVSWENLEDHLRRCFTLLAVFEGRPFTVDAFAAVADEEPLAAEDDLYALVSLSLVAEEGKIHFRQHPLLADFAREYLDESQEAYGAMAEYFLSYAQQHAAEYSELEEEWDNITAGMRVAYQQKHWNMVLAYAESLKQTWFARGHFSDARQGFAWMLHAAQELGRESTQAECLAEWAHACIEQGDYEEASRHTADAYELYAADENLRGMAQVDSERARIAIEQARYEEAEQLLSESHDMWRQLDDPSGVSEALYWRANVKFYTGAYEVAAELAMNALTVPQQAGDDPHRIRILHLLADIAYMREDFSLAERRYKEALRLCEQLQNSTELASLLYSLSEVERFRGRYESARDNAERSLSLLSRMGDRKSQARVLYRLSLIDADRGDHESSRELARRSLELCRELGDTQGLIIVLRHLGDLLADDDDSEGARELWAEAVQRAEEIGYPDMASLRARLESE